MILASAVLLIGLGGPSPDLMRLQQSFLRGSASIDVGGALPGKVFAFGDQAVVLAVAKDGKVTSPVVVAAEFGKGRVAAMGHGAMLDAGMKSSSIQRLMAWLSQPGKPVGFFGDVTEGLNGKSFRQSDLVLAMRECSALVLPGHLRGFDASLIRQFVENGGGVLFLDTPWGWKQLNPGKELSRDHAGQKLLSEMGIGFADGYIDTGGGVKFLAPQAAHHARRALGIFESGETVSADTAGVVSDVLTAVLRDGWHSNRFVETVQREVREVGSKEYPIAGKPVGPGNFRARLGMVLFDQDWRSGKFTGAHPAAMDFPGPVGASVKVEPAIVKFESGVRRWRSTGRYALPGNAITVRLKGDLVGKKIRLRIGGHSDSLWHLENWQRMPSVDLEVPFVDGAATAQSPFGGLVYLVSSEELPAGEAEILMTTVAPVFVKGQTSNSDWRLIRESEVPWGEIVGDQSAICVPARVLRNLDDPGAVANYFDEMVREAEKLYAVEPGTTEHRYQVDRQISAGYMHAGYPIMTWEDVSYRFVDISVLRGNEGGPLWGFYHELGHNYQRPEWTWNGWGETTNNLFSLWGGAHFNGQVLGHGAMAQSQVDERLAAVRANPGGEAFYRKDPWYGLTFWDMIRREYGFGVFTEYFAWCKGQALRSEQAKKDAFVVEMSRILRRDLTKYCRMWGVEISETAASKAGVWPEWLPSGLRE